MLWYYKRIQMKAKAKKQTKKPEDYPTLTVRLPAECRDRIDALCSRTVFSRAQIVVMALRKHLPELEKAHL